MLLDDRQMKVREIAETIGISKECVGYILYEELDKKKLCARWVQRLLTAGQKRTRMKISEQRLERFNENKTDFVRLFITMDETWIHHYTPESHGSGFDLASERNECQEYLLGRVRWLTLRANNLPPLGVNYIEIVVVSNSCRSKGLSRPVMG